jgi:ABC-type glycerol-3-phosphate transport system permease component
MTTLAAHARPALFAGTPLRLIVALIMLVNGLFPAVWILFTSLKTEAELTQKPISWLPAEPTLQNYLQAFTDQPLHVFLGHDPARRLVDPGGGFGASAHGLGGRGAHRRDGPRGPDALADP